MADCNRDFVSGLSRYILTLVGISCRGNCCDSVIYVWLVIICLCIGTKLLCVGGGRIEPDLIGGRVWSIGCLFKYSLYLGSGIAYDLVGILINVRLLFHTPNPVSMPGKLIMVGV